MRIIDLKKRIGFFFLLSIYLNTWAQYEKPEGVIRFMTYNVAYCRGYDGFQNGSKTDIYNTQRIGKIIKALHPDVVALQELDSANINNRYLLEDIKNASGIDYQMVYGVSDYDAYAGNYGNGILIKKDFPVLGVKRMKLPGTVYGSEPPIKNNSRLLLRVMTEKFYFMCTHLDLDTEQRINSGSIINNELDYMRKPSFLAGDMNDSHRWGGGVFTSSFNETWDLYSTTDYTISLPDNQNTIDYILYHNYKNRNEYSAVSSYAVRGKLDIPGESYPIQVEYASDHLPVILDVKDNFSTGLSESCLSKVLVQQRDNQLSLYGLSDFSYTYFVYSMAGFPICSGTVRENENLIPLDFLEKGLYILKLMQGEQTILNWKFVRF